MKLRWLPIITHLVGWLIFVTLPVMVVPHPPVIPDSVPASHVLLFLAISGIPLIGLFYGNLLVALPRLFLRRRYVYFAVFILSSLAMVIAMTRLLYEGFDWVQEVFAHEAGFLMRGTAYRTTVVVVASFSLFIYQRWRLAEYAKAQAELAFLKAQINPHFLFNTLNSIYYLTLQKSDLAPNAVEKLSAIMRYVIDEGGQDRVSLDREIAYLNDYIALQKLRFSQSVRIDLQVIGDLSGKQIAPLLLVSFVENAFKHGISMEHDSPIVILIAVSSGHLRFEVQNRKFAHLPTSDHESGIGLENTRRRLEIAYPSAHRVEVHETTDSYHVTLILEKL